MGDGSMKVSLSNDLETFGIVGQASCLPCELPARELETRASGLAVTGWKPALLALLDDFSGSLLDNLLINFFSFDTATGLASHRLEIVFSSYRAHPIPDDK